MATGGTGWKVKTQTETVGLGPDGKPTEGVKVVFETDAGIVGSVFVPKLGFNANKVKAAIQEYVGHLDATAKLGG